MAYVRPYSGKDFERCIEIFSETADESLHFEPGLTLGSYLWCRPYLHLSPSTCFVLDDGAGRAVGYCIGTPNTAEFCQRWRKDYLPSLSRESDPLVFQRAGLENEHPKVPSLLDSLWNDIEGGCNGSVDGLWDAYPGHLHINILPSHQRQGYGPPLIQALAGELTAKSCKGIHMGVVASNMGALKFYERNGFARYVGVADGGLIGRKGGTVIMVKSL